MRLIVLACVSLWSCEGAGRADQDQPESGHDELRDFQSRMAGVEERLNSDNSQLRDEWMSDLAAKQAADRAREQRVRSRSERLHKAMLAFIAEHEHMGNAVAEHIDRTRHLSGLASVLVRFIDDRAFRGEWIPLNEEKAPALLASIAFYEYSWNWLNSRIKGSRGERCMFQVAPTAIPATGFTEDQVAKDPRACLSAALYWMQLVSNRCGDVPAERWLGAYATGGTCGGAPDAIHLRFNTARWLLAKMQIED